jgi:hypothetical protein
VPQANKPAMTSGPGAMSRRTDGGPASKQAIRYVSNMPAYGDAQQLMDMQAAAPMAKTNVQPTASPSQVAQAAQSGVPQQGQQVIPIDAPSQRPGEPVTQGAAAGPGAGPEVLNISTQAQNNGMTNALILLNQLGDSASPQVRQIRNALAAHLNNQAGNQ